jgi:ribosomal protein L11 methyltransferase
MSFGTGHHSTTHLMILEMLNNMDKINNATVLDMGAGTGILGIVAEKLGAKKVTGIEIDDWVVDNANDNVAINHCEVTEMLLGTAETLDNYNNHYFDVILANIHREVILNDLHAYLRVLKPNGLILISGLQIVDLQLVNTVCLEKSLEKIAENTRNEWGVLGYLKK